MGNEKRELSKMPTMVVSLTRHSHVKIFTGATPVWLEMLATYYLSF